MLLRINCDPQPGHEQHAQLEKIYGRPVDLSADSQDVMHIHLEEITIEAMYANLWNLKMKPTDLIELGVIVSRSVLEAYCRLHGVLLNLPPIIRATTHHERFRCYEMPSCNPPDKQVRVRDLLEGA